eukprot:1875648-Amphidinium_carterae.1
MSWPCRTSLKGRDLCGEVGIGAQRCMCSLMREITCAFGCNNALYPQTADCSLFRCSTGP